MKKSYLDPDFKVVTLSLKESIASGYEGGEFVNESSALYPSGETDIPIIEETEFEL